MVKSKKKIFRNKKNKSKKKIYKGGNNEKQLNNSKSKKDVKNSVEGSDSNSIDAEKKAIKDVKNSVEGSDSNSIDAEKKAKKDVKNKKGILSKARELASSKVRTLSGTVNNLASSIFTRGLEHSKQVGLSYNDLLSPYLCDDCKECVQNIIVTTVKESNKNNKNKIIDLPNKLNLIEKTILDCYLFENEKCTIKNINNEKCKECNDKIKIGKENYINRRTLKEDPDKERLIELAKDKLERESLAKELKEKGDDIDVQQTKKEETEEGNDNKPNGGKGYRRKTKKKLKKKYYLEKYYKSKRN